MHPTRAHRGTSTQLEKCLREPPPYQPGLVRAFCDFAAGGDIHRVAGRTGTSRSKDAERVPRISAGLLWLAGRHGQVARKSLGQNQAF